MGKTKGTTLRAKAGAARKGRPRSRWFQEIPKLPVAFGAVLAAIFIGLFAYGYANTTGPNNVNNIKCDSSEQLAYHWHSHLSIIDETQGGVSISIPYGIGIKGAQPNTGSDGKPYVASGSCFYWIHTHDATGVIHIEAPASESGHVYTLGDFFAVWSAAPGPTEKLDSTHVGTYTLQKGETLVAFVNGKKYTKDPNTIPLTEKADIVLEITPPIQDPPPTFDWTAPQFKGL